MSEHELRPAAVVAREYCADHGLCGWTHSIAALIERERAATVVSLKREHGPTCDACDPLTAHVRIAELVAESDRLRARIGVLEEGVRAISKQAASSRSDCIPCATIRRITAMLVRP
jgi:hypothetical protein